MGGGLGGGGRAGAASMGQRECGPARSGADGVSDDAGESAGEAAHRGRGAAARGFRIGAHAYEAPSLPAALHVVATPIGNLRDVTLRALEVLAAADMVAAEDTRHTRRLLDRYAIRRPLVAHHEHNEAASSAGLVAEIADGRSVALVSDAGTPLVSDPGGRLVARAREAGLPVLAVPGPSSPVAALSVAGLATDAFTFAGFPPPKAAARRGWLERFRAVPGTLVLLESPHRLADALADMAAVLGPRPAAVARELTKAHEEVARGTLPELAARFAARPPRGEIVVCVEAGAEAALDPEAVLRELLGQHAPSRAAAEAARLTGRPKRELYALAIALAERADDDPAGP